MKLKISSRKGQGTLEYALVFVAVVGALIAMQWYIRGGMQGRWKSASDDIGDQFSAHSPSNFTTSMNSSSNEVITPTGMDDPTGSSTTMDISQNQTVVGSSSYEVNTEMVQAQQ
jgi:uncharacterized protein (UPF0333 family)